MRSLTQVLPAPMKRRLKQSFYRWQWRVSRAVYSYTSDDLGEALAQLGVRAGDALIVHSGFRRTSGFRDDVGAVIDTLRDTVGPDGHLVMMSMAYRGSTERYTKAGHVFDVVRTPSAMGIISEKFRRMPDVRRSLNPFHPVLVCGPKAAWLVTDHDKGAYSCGKGSPFERLLKMDAAVLFLDAPFRSLTFMHYVEHMFKDRLPVPLYTDAPGRMAVRDLAGREREVAQYYFHPAARARRRFEDLETELTRRGSLKRRRIGNTELRLVTLRDVVEGATHLMNEGGGLYAD